MVLGGLLANGATVGSGGELLLCVLALFRRCMVQSRVVELTIILRAHVGYEMVDYAPRWL